MTQEELNNKLLYAVENNDIDGVKEVLSLGAYVNSADAENWTSLMNAAWYGYTDIARLLLEHGADINHKNNNGHTALDILKEQYPEKYRKWIEETVVKPRQKQLNKEDSSSEQTIDWNI